MAGLTPILAYLLPDPEHSAVARSLLAVGYVVAALLWLRATRRARQEPAASFWRWWLLGAVLLFLLALNKQFDFRSHLELGFRSLARAGNWYDRRQPLQFVLAVALPSALAVLGGILLATKARVFARCNPLALAGWVLLMLYLGLRQSQEWKPMLPWLEWVRYHDWRLALETAGLLLVGLAALLPQRRSTATQFG